MRNTDFHLYYVWLWLDLRKMNVDLIEYSVLHYAVTQTNVSYRQSYILCEMHLKFNCADS